MFERKISTTFRGEELTVRHEDGTFTLSSVLDGDARTAQVICLTVHEAIQVKQAIADAIWQAQNGPGAGLRPTIPAPPEPEEGDEPAVGDEVRP